MSPLKAHDISRINKSQVIKAVRERGELSRQEIALYTGLSPATATRAVESLVNVEKLLVETGSKATPKGRPFKTVKFNPDSYFMIGVDIGATSIRAALTNLNAQYIKEVEVLTEVGKGPEYVLDKVASVIEKLYHTSFIEKDKIAGVGLAIGGMVNNKTGKVEYSPTLNWSDVDLKKHLADRFHIPIIFDNVVRVMALGEMNYGKGAHYDNFIVVNVGYGVGAGIIAEKKLFMGTDGMSGELAHFPVVENWNIPCLCGKTGCLSSTCSGRAIAARAVHELEGNKDSSLVEIYNNRTRAFEAKDVFEAARNGDKLSNKVLDDAARYLGGASAGMVSLFNPQAVLFGGGVILNNEGFFEKVKEHLKKGMIRQCSTNVDVEMVGLKENAAVMGALSLVLNNVLELNFEGAEE